MLFQLDRRLEFSPTSRLSKLDLPCTENENNNARSCLYAGFPAVITGFGWDKLTNFTVIENFPTEIGSSAGKLLKATAVVLSNSECKSIVAPRMVPVREEYMCAKIYYHHAHQGVCHVSLIYYISYNYELCN